MGLSDDRQEEILAFLERYPAVAPLLIDTRSNIRRFFGEDPVMLKVSHDLDWEDDQPELFANIQTRLLHPLGSRVLSGAQGTFELPHPRTSTN